MRKCLFALILLISGCVDLASQYNKASNKLREKQDQEKWCTEACKKYFGKSSFMEYHCLSASLSTTSCSCTVLLDNQTKICAVLTFNSFFGVFC